MGGQSKGGERTDVEKLGVGLLGPADLDAIYQEADSACCVWPLYQPPPPQGIAEVSPRACRSHPPGSRMQGLPEVPEEISQQAGQESRLVLLL